MGFCLPYIDQPLSFWNNLKTDFGEYIEEIYFPMSVHILPSGRPKQSSSYIFSFLEKVDLPKSVLINPVVLPQPISETEDTILNELIMLNKNYGITRTTVSDLQLCKSIKTHLKKYQISASVLMRINSPEQISYLQNYINCLAIDTAIVRDLAKFKSIRDNFSGLIKLIVNEGCLSHCPFRTQHFYEMSRDLPHPESLCEELIHDLPWLRLKSAWILPQHLHFYDGLYDFIKLAGRVTLQNPQKFITVFRAYLERSRLAANEIGSGPAGMIEAMPISEEFFYQTITCDKECSKCDICKNYYEKHNKAK